MILSQFWEDTKFSVSQMLKRPVLSLTVVICLALGLGPNLAIFSLLNTILYAPINIPDVDQLRSISKYREGFGASRDGAFSFPEIFDLQRQLAGKHTFTGENKTSCLLYVDNDAYDVAVSAVSNSYFEILTVEPVYGRLFESQIDFVPGGMPEIVLSHQFWQAQFNSDPDIIGKTVNLNASLTNFYIIGVLPPDFYGTSNYMLADIYVPYEMAADVFPQDPDILSLRGRNTNLLYTRVESETAERLLQEELDVFGKTLSEESNDYEGLRFIVDKPTDIVKMLLPPSVATPLFISVLLLVGLILLLASSSVATLILSRASERTNEIAVRISSGASVAVVIKQLLTEGLVLTLCAAFLAWIMALWFAEALPGMVIGVLPLPIHLSISELIMDYRVLLYGLTLVIVSTLITSLLPAIQVSRGNLVSGLKEDPQQITSQRSTNRLRHFFLIIQFALCTVLLIACGLSYQSLRLSADLDLGFSHESLLTFSYVPARIGFLGPQAEEFSYGLADIIRETEDVRQVSISSTHPFTVFNVLNNRSIVPVSRSGEAAPMITPNVADIGVDFFDALEVTVLQGRSFTLDDLKRPSRNTLVLNEAMAEQIFGNSNALGRHFLSGATSLRVVGIVADYYSGTFSTKTPLIFYPIRRDRYDDQTFISIQTTGISRKLINELKNNIAQYDDRLLLNNLVPISNAITNALAPLQMISIFCGILGGLALLLTLIGIYGVNSYHIGLRRKDIGIRLSLGASPLRLCFSLIRSGLLVVVIGLGLGIGVAYFVAPLLSGLFNVSPRDVTTFVAVTLFILTIATCALSIPSWRITRTEPINSLRYD